MLQRVKIAANFNQGCTMDDMMLLKVIARKFSGRGVEVEDLIQEGWFGLIRAKEKYDPSRGVKFSTFANWWICQSMRRAIEAGSSSVRAPASYLEKKKKISRAVDELTAKGEAITVASIAARAGVSKKAVQRIQALNLSVSSMTACEGEKGLLDTLIDESSPSPEARTESAESNERVGNLLSSVDGRSREILNRRLGLFGESETLEEIAKDMGLTRERIRQIEKQALEKLARVSR